MTPAHCPRPAGEFAVKKRLKPAPKARRKRKPDPKNRTAAEVPSCRLMPELVPKPLWKISLYRLLPRSQWESLRRSELALSGNRCAVCLAAGPGLICHERWFYNDGQDLAVLVGFEIHCQDCDLVTHMGRAFMKGLGHRAIEQFCKQNSSKPELAIAVFEHALSTWRERNKKTWAVGFDDSVIAKYPMLAGLIEATANE